MTPETAATIDAIEVNLNAGGMNTINIVLAFVMFGVALGIKPRMFVEVFKKPKSVLLGACSQLILLPAFTCGLALLFGKWISPMMGLGMVLVAACPGGNISNFMSSLAKGNVELSVSLTAISTALAVLMTPFNFWLWGNLYLKFAALTGTLTIPQLVIPFGEIFKTVFIILGIPIVLGMLFSHYLPKTAEKIQKPFSIFSIAVFIVMVLGMFLPNWQLFIKYIIFIFCLVLVHNACALGTGFCGATAMRLPLKDRRSITIEVGIQNSGLGLTLLLNPAIFRPEIWNNPETGVMYGGMLFVTAWWGIWHIISGLTVATLFRRRPLPEY
jgi:BASS family bile acid:Na+ symporter